MLSLPAGRVLKTEESPGVTLDKARELIRAQLTFGGGYNRNAVRIVLSEISRDHKQRAVDQPIVELELGQDFGLKPGTDFSRVAG